jgi:hypothetical protein
MLKNPELNAHLGRYGDPFVILPAIHFVDSIPTTQSRVADQINRRRTWRPPQGVDI